MNEYSLFCFVSFFFFKDFIYLFMRDTERGRDSGRGRSPMWDLIPGPRDHTVSWRQMLNHWATQVSRQGAFVKPRCLVPECPSLASSVPYPLSAPCCPPGTRYSDLIGIWQIPHFNTSGLTVFLWGTFLRNLCISLSKVRGINLNHSNYCYQWNFKQE